MGGYLTRAEYCAIIPISSINLVCFQTRTVQHTKRLSYWRHVHQLPYPLHLPSGSKAQMHRAQRYSRQHSLCPCCGRTFDGRGNRKGSVEGGRFVILEREYTTFWSNMICFQILLYARIRNKPSFSSPWIYFKCMYKDAITTKIDGTPRNTLVILCNGEYLPYFFSPFTSGFFSLNFSFSISPISLRSLPCFSIILMAL